MVYAIAVKQDQYQTYILEDKQAQSRIEVVPNRGGIISQWRIQGQPILYLDTERFANPEQSIRGGVPILFPICGDLPDDTFYYQGQEYTLKRHGFARDLPWQVVDTSAEASAQITLKLESSPETLAVYPFDFELVFTYRLQGTSLVIEQDIKNLSQRTMPFSLGLHPYFWVANKQTLAFDIPAPQYLDQITQEIHPYSGEFDFEAEEIDIALYPLSRHLATVTHQQRKIKVHLSFSDLYSNIVFWTVNGKEYYCLEPWTARRNALNTGEQITQLEPGDRVQARVEMSVSDI